MFKKHSHFFVAFLGLGLFSLALWVLHRELTHYRYQEIIRYIHAIPVRSLVLSLVCTFLCYFDLTLYDYLACRYLGKPLPFKQTALVGFIGYAFSNSIGLANLAGGSIRYRFYTAWNYSALQVAKILLFCATTFWLGFATLFGVVLLVVPLSLPETLHLPFASARPLGFVALSLVLAYVAVVLFRRGPLIIRDRELPLPSGRLLVGQFGVGILDWSLAGAALYMLLPTGENLSYFRFLGTYLLATVAGLISQVPGGLGVFESVVVLTLGDKAAPSEILGSLVAFRLIYYLLPLCCATVLLGGNEIYARKYQLIKVGSVLARWMPSVVPQVASISTFLCGAILLFSGSVPGIHSRLALLGKIVPLSVIEMSHFLGSLVGVGLLLLSRGLQRRLDAAYFLTVSLLYGGILFSLLKGFDFEEAALLGVMLLALTPCRRHFYRKASLLNLRFTPEWNAAILVILVASIWLGFFVHKHVDYSADLWWRFALTGDAPRFLRASVGVVCVTLFVSLASLLRHAEYEPGVPTEEELAQAEPLIRASRETYPYLALLRDKEFLFSENGRAFLMFGVEGRAWVVFKDPVGDEDEFSELIWRFRSLADRHGGWPVFYQIGQNYLDLYIAQGMTFLKIGEEAYVPLLDFSVDGKKHKRLRQACNRFEKQGYSFQVLEAREVGLHLGEIRTVSEAWLSNKSTGEKGFSLGFFDADYLQRLPLALVRLDNQVVAFANILTSADHEEISVDLMRYTPEVLDGAMDFLFTNLMIWGREQGYRRFCLGMAPLAGLEARALAPRWNRVAQLIFRHGEHFYNFQGLRQYKEKFDPEWEPRYLASPGGLAIPRIFLSIATLTSGSMRGIVGK
jgi:phosphatidylglycerol lysyltransferase